MAAARRRAGLAQVELAVALGDRYNQPMISMVERSRSSLLLDGAVKAAKELGVSLDYLTGLTDDPTPAAELSEQAASAGIDDASVPVNLTTNEKEALAIARDLRDPLIRGWLQSGAALLESQTLRASQTPATDR